MKTFQVIALCFTSYVCNAQLAEHFDDGNFTVDPLWSGAQSQFVVNAGQQLQLNNTVAGASYLSTPFEAASIDDFEWVAYIKQSFAPSGSNYGRIYLVADHENLGGPLNGYYLQLGEAGSNDAVELFRQTGTVHTSVCRATNAGIAASFSIRVKVIRSSTAVWTLFIDYAGGVDFVEAAHGTDATYTTSSYFGVYCLYTAGNANKFFFDDLIAGPPLGDITPPELTDIQVPNDSTLLISFSEPLDSTVNDTLSGYSVSDSIGRPAMILGNIEWTQVTLIFQAPFVNGKLYEILIDSVADPSGNWSEPISRTFRHFVSSQAAAGNIIFNELYPDPSPSLGLPAQEFLELFNASDKAFNLEGWSISDLTNATALPSIFLLPGEYLIVTSTAGLSNYNTYGPTLGLPEMPTLNNTSDSFVLRDSTGIRIDSVHYALAWYGDDDLALGGYSLERLQSTADSNQPLNWRASLDSIGGTPGRPNSVMGHKLDITPPRVDSLTVISDHELGIYFNEPVDSLSLLDPDSFSIESSHERPSEISFAERSLNLSFASRFINGADDHLLISHVLDTASNAIDSLRLKFRHFVPGVAVQGSVVISEIMADPSPIVYLPEAEFIEIVNRDTVPFDLRGWTLSDATSTATLPSTAILPGEFIILTASSNAPKFLEMGTVVGIPGFPSLNNSGEPLIVRSSDGHLIDSLRFDIQWFDEDPKRDGGWSLERLLLNYSSASALNWRPSRDSLGGTPGRINSIVGDKLDSKPPAVDSLVVLSDVALRVVFSEPMDSSSVRLPCRYSVSGVCPATVVASRNSATLTFLMPFGNGHSKVLVVDSVTDASGNQLARTTLAFRYFVPGYPHRGDVVINEIMSDPAPVVHLPEAEYVEIFNRSSEPFDLRGWSIADASSAAVILSAVILPHEFVVLTNSTNTLKFSEDIRLIGLSGFPSLNNAGEPLVLRSADSTIIDSLYFSVAWIEDAPKKDGGWSLERLLYDYQSTSPLNWRPALDSAGGTPGRTNSVVGEKLDVKPPVIDSLLVLGEKSLRVFFNEPMDSLSLTRLTSYSINITGEGPVSAMPSVKSVELIFSESFINGRDKVLIVHSVMDSSGNVLDRTGITFRHFIPGKPAPGDVVFNEIMFDPAPVVHLPEAEYIEIFNRSAAPFDLKGWTLKDASTSAALPAEIILPGEFAILTSTAASTRFAFGLKTIGVPGFPSLNNSGESLVLRSADSTIIDSLTYDIGWLDDAVKRDGGWSLERLLYDYPSNSSLNWRVAIDTSGGTPGEPNSILGQALDIVSPGIDSLRTMDPNTLMLYFNEPMDSSSLFAGTFAIEGLNERPAIGLTSDMVVTLMFGRSFGNGVENFIRIDNVTDLSGNPIAQQRLSFMYFIPGEVKPSVILINEIMPDPSPVVGLPEAEYIEIVNHGNEPYDLQGWSLSDLTQEGLLPARIILPGEHVILTSTFNAAKFEAANVIGVPGFPSLSNTGEPLMLFAPGRLLVDSIHYYKDWFGRTFKQDGGWSLERLLLGHPSADPMNWRPSIDSAGGTPGKMNSIAGHPLDIIPPSIDSVVVTSAHSLSVYFNEPMDSHALGQVENYLVEENGANPMTIEPFPNSVTLYFEAAFINGHEYYLWVRALADTSGNACAPTRIRFRHFVPSKMLPGMILINEIMADPVPVVQMAEAEFVEIVNPGVVPIDLQGWTLSDATSTTVLPAAIVMPGEYLILTTTTSESKFDDRALGVAGFPSLNNGGEPIILRSPEGVTIDSVHYDMKWFGTDPKADGDWTLERLRFEFSSTWDLNWRPSLDLRGGTPGTANSRFGEHPDQQPPHIVGVMVIDQHAIEVTFDEPVVLKTGEGAVRIDSIECAAAVADGSRARFVFDLPLINGSDYTLHVEGIRDSVGNEMSATDLDVSYFEPSEVEVRDLVITEIMADPAPVIGLPEAEYIEVLNRSVHPINLAGWSLTDGLSVSYLPRTIVMPGEYKLISSLSGAEKFSSIKVIGINAFPSLSNEGEPLVLQAPDGLMIDSVFYSDDWYHNIDKADGGWSLELIDMENPCGSGDNWTASEAEAGGSPGSVNSVNTNKPDLSGPRLLRVEGGMDRMLLQFNERLEKSLVHTTVEIVPSAGTLSLSFADPSLKTVVVQFERQLQVSTQYEVTVQNVFDCNRNEIDSQFNSARFAIPETPKPGDIVINEILFDPRPNGVDFVEAYNVSPRYIELSGWTLGGKVEADKGNVPSGVVVTPQSHIVFTADPAVLNSQYPHAMEKTFVKVDMPSFPDDEGAIVLRDSEGLLVDSMNYSANMHSQLLRDTEGVSLERVSPVSPSRDLSNWASANESAGFATPGYVNSGLRNVHTNNENVILVTPEVLSFHAPETFVLIQYSLEEPGYYVNCRILDQQGRRMKEIAQNVSVGSQGFFRWEGDDVNGRRVLPGYYLVYFEYYSMNGQVHISRSRVVVAPR
jgi:hypothetical protein